MAGVGRWARDGHAWANERGHQQDLGQHPDGASLVRGKSVEAAGQHAWPGRVLHVGVGTDVELASFGAPRDLAEDTRQEGSPGSSREDAVRELERPRVTELGLPAR